MPASHVHSAWARRGHTYTQPKRGGVTHTLRFSEADNKCELRYWLKKNSKTMDFKHLRVSQSLENIYYLKKIVSLANNIKKVLH